jgi:hypothetical protein
MLNVEVRAVMDSEPRMLLKTIGGVRGACDWDTTLGAIRMNNLRMVWTRAEITN